MKSADIASLVAVLPGPDGQRYRVAFTNGSMTALAYAPVTLDAQQPHEQDEVYFVANGSGTIVVDGERQAVAPGHVIFVPAGATHRFESFSAEFAVWAVLWPERWRDTRAAGISTARRKRGRI